MPKSKAEIWDYFIKDATTGYAKCTLCKKEYKTSGNTSNIRDHMKQSHAGSSFHKDREEREPEEVGDSRMTVAGPSRPKQSKLHSFVAEKATQYGDQSEKKKKLDKELALMIAKDMQPFSIVTDKGFQGFCHALDPRYKLPSRTQVSSVLLSNLYDEAKTRLRHMLTEASDCAITADMWTSCTTDSYVTVTCHFVQDTVLRSAVLSTTIFRGAHTAENVAQAIAGVAEDWGIRGAIVALVTDNDKRMILASRLLSIEHLPCFAHTLNLTVQDGLKSSDELNDVLLKCKNIVRHVRSSSMATAKLREEQERAGKVPPLKLMQETPTRWNSVLYMLKRILEVGEALTLTLTKLPRAPSPLSAEDIMLIEDVVQILDPFEEATKLLSGDQYTTVSLIVPAVCGIATELNERIEPALKTAVAKEVLRECVSALHRRMDAYEKTRLAASATLLDSRMKERAFLDSTNAERAKAGLIDELGRRMSQNHHFSEDRLPEHLEASPEATQGSRILGFLDKRDQTPVTPTSNSELMLRQYLEMLPQGMNVSPLEFWRSNQSTMKPLCEMALKYLCVPATSVPAERVFSTAGQIVSDRRSRLKGKNVDRLIFLHQNCWLSQN